MSYKDDKWLALLPLELPHDQKNEYHSFIPNKIPNETKQTARTPSRKAGISLRELTERDNKNNEKTTCKNKKEYLNINDSQRTFFENLDYEHPYHQSLTNEQEKEIHNQGLLTPEEAVRYWESGFSDVCIPSDKNRCERFKDCHDCLVHYSETKPNGWEPIHYYQKTLGPKPSSNK